MNDNIIIIISWFYGVDSCRREDARKPELIAGLSFLQRWLIAGFLNGLLPKSVTCFTEYSQYLKTYTHYYTLFSDPRTVLSWTIYEYSLFTDCDHIYGTCIYACTINIHSRLTISPLDPHLLANTTENFKRTHTINVSHNFIRASRLSFNFEM